MVGGIKIRIFHSQAAGQRLIHDIEDAIPKSGMLFREKRFDFWKSLCRVEGAGGCAGLLQIGIWNWLLAEEEGGHWIMAGSSPGHHKSCRNYLGNVDA